MGKWKKPRDRYKIKKRPVDEDTAGDGAEPNKQIDDRAVAMALGVYSHSSPDLKAQAVPTPSAWGADDSPMAADQADRSDRKADPWLSKTDRRKERRRKLLSRLQLDARVQKEKKTISVVSLSASLLDLQNELDTADPNAVTTRGRSRPLSSRARKHVVQRESAKLAQVLAHPAFQKDAHGALQQHIINSLPSKPPPNRYAGGAAGAGAAKDKPGQGGKESGKNNNKNNNNGGGGGGGGKRGNRSKRYAKGREKAGRAGRRNRRPNVVSMAS